MINFKFFCVSRHVWEILPDDSNNDCVYTLEYSDPMQTCGETMRRVHVIIETHETGTGAACPTDSFEAHSGPVCGSKINPNLV